MDKKSEFQRLEDQAKVRGYDYRTELTNLKPLSPGARILDAGCGSGVVSRYVASRFPEAQVVGCDFSEIRLKQAKEAAAHLPNLRFLKEDLCRLSLKSESFDLVLSRFVTEHQSPEGLMQLLREAHRVLRTGGEFRVIDLDGLLYNLFPQTPEVASGLSLLRKTDSIDLYVGRKLPSLLLEVGFSQVQWRIETMEFAGKDLRDEIVITAQRLENAKEFLVQILGGESAYRSFAEAYLRGMEAPGAVVFYNKFIVSGTKSAASASALRLIK